MTSITQLNNSGCEKIDALEVDAYFKLKLNEENTNLLELETSWGTTSVDLSPFVKNNETITTLFITEDGALQYNREDYGREGAPNGGVDCIHGDKLSRIISMRYLKDVNQDKPVKDGDVYMHNYQNDLFEPFALQDFVDKTDETLEVHGAQIAQFLGTVQALQSTIEVLTKRLATFETRLDAAEENIAENAKSIANHETRITTIEATLQKPAGIPSDTRLVWGNRNAIADYTNTNKTTSGLYTHNPSQWQPNDTYDA